MTHPSLDDRRIEVIIGNLLRAGVLMAAAVVLFGAVIYLSHYAFQPTDFRVFRFGATAELRSVASIVKGAVHLRGESIIQLGLLLLIATPISRVIFSVFGFVIERDYLYVLITLIVLAVLLYSLLGSGVA
jgi:uncharacterized membrane protein